MAVSGLDRAFDEPLSAIAMPELDLATVNFLTIIGKEPYRCLNAKLVLLKRLNS
jgi:hypothetical protein